MEVCEGRARRWVRGPNAVQGMDMRTLCEVGFLESGGVGISIDESEILAMSDR